MDEITDELYNIGTKLGFSLAHIRKAIEKTSNLPRLLRQWEKLATEPVRYLAWSGSRDYTTDFWKSMVDEPEPVDDAWLKKFAEDAAGK